MEDRFREKMGFSGGGIVWLNIEGLLFDIGMGNGMLLRFGQFC